MVQEKPTNFFLVLWYDFMNKKICPSFLTAAKLSPILNLILNKDFYCSGGRVANWGISLRIHHLGILYHFVVFRPTVHKIN